MPESKLWNHRIRLDYIDRFNKFCDKLGLKKRLAVEFMIDHFIKTFKGK